MPHFFVRLLTFMDTNLVNLMIVSLLVYLSCLIVYGLNLSWGFYVLPLSLPVIWVVLELFRPEPQPPTVIH